ncbi:flagellar hook-length control protein FliK [Xanthomonas nasturtii]|uniref:Flagellar hook-length control protein FliK n=1 Tax=Xanthomonas nasturtii TaxID=1843581 RepID=A0A3E1KLZ1_9XANT|nr:flagellar hook-length control protein FliK [Xanthomonas nasturtii]MCL1530287.1 flagellar hook-length control protein FliK [Xanthomonas nasturtii]MCL1565433.1 flagellar hook-length control protein FliK [Xanthomonas nasturtii]MCL1569375.1 flagellar hook-length control protein FliK [Xanthomonas nasturtii]MCL1573201.1 flagellar hook-length control protein FliK [Xanthomonas nasturtii]MCL1580613.1 flagellar hook-length control protein FliK [Xanthomonas nasturtii]
MNPLSAFAAGLGALAGTGKTSSYSDPSSEPDAGQDQFARMLNPANTPNQAPPQAPERVPAKQAAPKPNQSDNNRSDDDTHDDAAGDATARPRAQDGEAKPARSGAAKDPAATDSSTAAGTGKPGKTTKAATAGEDAPADAATATDAGWPPPGLGGFGMGLLAQALPGGDVLAAAAAALTASMAGAAGATASATALPTDATAATATATANAATALPALGALVPAAAAGAKPTSSTAVSGDAQTAALMSMAAKALEPAADDSAAPAAPDAPAFVLPTTTTAPALTRLQDAAPIFSASPTPTPDLGSDNFDDAIGARMSWLADQKIGHAHIKVTPNEMGPVEVRLHLDGDKVNASFTAANADTRQALEQSLPRLREMLGQNGFQLGQADVGQQQQNPSGNRNGANGSGNGLSLDDAPPVGIPSVVLRQRGLLDAYA